MNDPAGNLLQASGVAGMKVTAADTAIALGSGDVAVLGTPRLIALMEQSTCEALRGLLPASRTSVGTHVSIAHRKPSPLDSDVTARATVIAVEGDVVTFEVSASHHTAFGDTLEDVATGMITRVVVDRDRFAAD